MSECKTRIGLIGAGMMGALHLQHFSRLPDVEMAAVADSNPVRLKEAQATYGIAAGYSNGVQLIAESDVDGVIISVPNRLHAPLAIAALRAGRHVLLEKPMATSAADAKAILDAEKASGRKLLIGHQMRWSWPYAAIKSQVETGQFGKIYYVKTGWFRRKGIPAWGSPYTSRAHMGGGAAVDIGVHMLDLAMHVIGGDHKPVSVFGTAYSKIGTQRMGLGSWGERNMAGSFDVDDLAAAMIRLDDSTFINLEVSWAAFTDAEDNGPYLHLMGDAGGVSVRNSTGRWMIERFDSLVDVDLLPPEQRVDERTSIARHFVDCIQLDAAPLVSGWSGYINSAILEALYRSSETGREVTISV
jgi:predicted dehydrogenase